MNINIIAYSFFQLLLNLQGFGLDSVKCYNKERVSFQSTAIV